MLHRIGHIAMWRYIHRVHPLADRLSLRWGRAARLLRWPLPAMRPTAAAGSTWSGRWPWATS